MSIENTILNNLIHDENYCRKVIPFIKEEYFTSTGCKIVFNEIADYVMEYNALPNQTVLSIQIDKRDDLSESSFKEVQSVIDNIKNEESEFQWIVNTTEKWCQERAIYLSLMESIKIADGKDTKKDKGAIPHILSEALAISFDSHVGHDYIDDALDRYEYYHQTEEKIPFDLDFFNKITKGGLPAKTLNIALAGTGVGKSLFMCHVAASCLLQGKNVLYITMEMAEEKIAERIDANLLNVNIKDISTLPKVMFDKKIANLSKKTQGK